MYKNAQGNTVSVAQMQKWADLEGTSIGEYAIAAGYSYVAEEEVTDVATAPVTNDAVATPSRASMIVDAGKEKDFVDVTTETKSFPNWNPNWTPIYWNIKMLEKNPVAALEN